MSNTFNKLFNLIENKDAVVGIIGLGYVGLPIVIRFCEEGFRVIGFDVDPAKTESLSKGKSYIKHIPSEKIASFVKKPSPSFEATTDMSNLKRADAIIICVPTPLNG